MHVSVTTLTTLILFPVHPAEERPAEELQGISEPWAQWLWDAGLNTSL
jgi:hypothetical protein